MPPAPDTTIADTLLAWFEREGRDWPWRATRDRWCILVSEVCLQQTQVGRAAPFINRILERFPEPAVLAEAPLAELLALWQGLGYPRRARNLQLAAQLVAEQGWPDSYRDLPGVGPYTDAALRCFADEQPVVPPDINTRRVLGRLFPDGKVTAPAAALAPGRAAWAWGQAVMELGQRTCRARANCAECPLEALCPSAGTLEVVASPRQARYEGSMRQRRGVLLRALTTDGEAPFDTDAEAAETLVRDGLAARSADGAWLLPAASARD
jgi:A/G-specific adenine glycosylase